MLHQPSSRVEPLRGTLDVLILRTLFLGPAHGHAIAEHIQYTSEAPLQVSQCEAFVHTGLLLKPVNEEAR